MSEEVVLVRLTKKQRGALRAQASISVDIGEGGRSMKGALAALDAAVPALTWAEERTLIDGTQWFAPASIRDRLIRKIGRLT